MKTFDINARSVSALQSCGVGHTGLERVCGLLNLPKPIACKNYDNISNRFGVAAKFIAEKGMGNGKSRLNDSIIDKLQNYFGIALRSNTGNLENMKESILASLFHI